MALTLSRIDRLPRTYDLAAIMAAAQRPVPENVTGVEVALLPPRSGPTAATVWTSVDYASGSFTVILAGPDADSADALAVPASADLWMKITGAPLVEAVKIERITVLGGGGTLPSPAAADGAVAALLNDTQSATYARVLELIEARAGFGR